MDSLFCLLRGPTPQPIRTPKIEAKFDHVLIVFDRAITFALLTFFEKVKQKMSWYCIEERNDSLKQFGRFQRRFLTEESYSLPNTQITQNQQSVSSLIFITKKLYHFLQTKKHKYFCKL